MIIGIGTDIAECARFERIWGKYGERFARRFLTHLEYSQLPEKGIALYLASRFAVKEAAVKALGTGFSDGIVCRDIGIVKNKEGRPSLVFTGKALAKADELGVTAAHVSYSHENEYAVAMVMLERLP